MKIFKTFKFLILAFCIGLSFPALAERADANKPTNIEADSFKFYIKSPGARPLRYLEWFTAFNLVMLLAFLFL